MMKMIFYGDESGNTSNNYKDEVQPNYTYCGILIKESDYTSIKSFILDLKEKYHFTGELKSRILNSRQGIKFSDELFEKLFSDFNCVPFYFVGSKKMILAHLVTDFFLDSLYNPLFNNLITYRSNFKLKFSDLISNNETILNLMQKIIKSDNNNEVLFQDVRSLIYNIHTLLDYYSIIKMPNIEVLEDITNRMYEQSLLIHNDSSLQINSLSVSGILQIVSEFTLKKNMRALIKLDNHRMIEEYHKIFESLSSDENTAFGAYSIEGEYIHLSYGGLYGLELVDSRKEDLIQVADLLNGIFKKSIFESNHNFDYTMSIIKYINSLFLKGCDCKLGIEMLLHEDLDISETVALLKNEIKSFLNVSTKGDRYCNG